MLISDTEKDHKQGLLLVKLLNKDGSETGEISKVSFSGRVPESQGLSKGCNELGSHLV